MARLVAELARILGSLALVTFVLGAIAWIVGLATVRDRLLRWAAGAFVLATLVPMLALELASSVPTLSWPSAPDLPASAPTVGVVVLGHLVLAVVLFRRWLRGPDAPARERESRERSRRRERERLPPRVGGDE